MRRLQVEKANHEASLKFVNTRLDAIRMTELPEAMEDAGIERIGVAGVGNVHLRHDLWASVESGQKAAAWEWLEDQGHGDLITRTVNASTFKAFAKEMLKAGEVLPEELFRVTPFTVAVITTN